MNPNRMAGLNLNNAKTSSSVGKKPSSQWMRQAIDLTEDASPSSFNASSFPSPTGRKTEANRRLSSLQEEILEESFRANDSPSYDYLQVLATKLKRPFDEIQSWFAKRRGDHTPTTPAPQRPSSASPAKSAYEVIDLEALSDAESMGSSSPVKKEPPVHVRQSSPLVAAERRASPNVQSAQSSPSPLSKTTPKVPSQERRTSVTPSPLKPKAVSKDIPKLVVNTPNYLMNYADLDDDLSDESPPMATPTLGSVENSSSSTSAQLPNLLAPLLSASGRITDVEHIPRLLKIMATRKDSDDRMEIISLLDKSRSDDVLNAMGSNVKIMTVLRSWIFTCMNTKDDECLLAILKYLSRLPITKESATASKIGKMVQKLTKEGAPAIKKLANEVKDNWFSKLDTPTPTAPTPVESSKSMPAKEDTRKRDRSTDSVQSSTSSMTGKPDIQVVSAKKARPSAATSSAKKGAVPIIPSPGPVEKKKAASVPSFDIFKSLSAKPDLPKIKKSDKPVERKPEKQEMRTTASEVVITSITPAEGAPAPLFSYRKEKPAESSDLKRVAEDDGSSGPKKKRKSVSFKPEKELVEVRYFESGEDERTHAVPNFGDLRDIERAEGRGALKELKEIVATKSWHLPSIYYFGEEELEWSTLSDEVATQEEREKKSFSVVYFKPEDIPDSPAEPDPADLVVNHTLVKSIPFEEFYNQNPEAKSALATLAALTATPTQQPTTSLQLPVQPASQSYYNHQPTGIPAMYQAQHFTPQVFQPQAAWTPQQQQYVPQNNYPYQSQQPQQHYQQQSYGNQQYGVPSYNTGGNHQRNYYHKANQACPFLKKGHCRMGESCHYSHTF